MSNKSKQLEPEEIAGHYAALDSASPKERRGAIKALGAAKADGIEAALLALLAKEESPQVRASAIKAFASLDTDAAKDVLLDALEEPSHIVRAAAATAIGKLHQPDLATYLHARIPQELETTPNALLAVVKALGKLLNATSLDHLRGLLGHEDIMVERAVKNTLHKFGLTPESLASWQAPTAEAPVIGEIDPSLQLLVEGLYDENERNVKQAIAALGRAGNPSALAPLLRAGRFTRHANIAVKAIFSRFVDPRERMALLRALLSLRLPRASLWEALHTIVDDWPDDDVELVTHYISAHIADWPDKIRSLHHKDLERYLSTGELPSQSLIRSLHPTGWGMGEETPIFLRSLVQAPLLSEVQELHMAGAYFTEENLLPFFQNMPPTSIEHLSILHTHTGHALFDTIADNREKHPNLSHFHFSNTLYNEMLQESAKHPSFLIVTELSIHQDWNEDTQDLTKLASILESPFAKNITGLNIHNQWHANRRYDANRVPDLAKTEAWQRLKKLSIHTAFMHQGRLPALIREGLFSHVEELSLSNMENGKSCTLALLASGCKHLRKLSLTSMALSAHSLKRLASWPGLQQIEELNLTGNTLPLADYEVLLKSPHWGAIQQVTLSRLSAKDSFALYEMFEAQPLLRQATLSH